MKVLLAVFAVVVLGIGYIGYGFYEGAKNYPDYAQAGVVNASYRPLINDIDAVVQVAESKLDLAARLEKLDYPAQTRYVALQLTEGEPIELLNRGEKGGTTKVFISNGYGYGNINDQDFIIIDYEINQYGVDTCRLYLLHPASPAA